MCSMCDVISGEEAGMTIRFLANHLKQWSFLVNCSREDYRRARLGGRYQKFSFRLAHFEMGIKHPSGGAE